MWSNVGKRILRTQHTPTVMVHWKVTFIKGRNYLLFLTVFSDYICGKDNHSFVISFSVFILSIHRKITLSK